MPENPIDSFLVDIGFAKPDAAGARAVENAVSSTEARITEVQARESAKRAATETKAQSASLQRLSKWFEQRDKAEEQARDDRAKATADLLGDMLGLDRAQTDKVLKNAKEGAGKAVEVEHDKAKKVSQIRAGQFKEASVDLLRFGSIAEKVSGGLASALSIAPFGGFLAGIERGASGLAKLDVQAKRVNSSAAGIQRFLFAMKQQGVDEGEASAALEGFASTMKSNPEGYRSALEGLGVKTTGRNGKPLNYDGMLENFENYLSKQPFNIARMQAGQFGISGDNAIAALQDPAGSQKGLQAYDAKLRGFGFDPNKAAEDARKVQQSWNNLEADFTIIKQKLDSEFFIPFMASLDALAQKMEQNPQAAASFGRGLEAFAIGLSARVLPTIANLVVKLTGLGAILGGSVGAALGIAVNPVVMAGASAESTPTAPVTTDPAERARKLASNNLPAGEMTAEEREAFSKSHGGGGGFLKDVWSVIKGKLGFGDDKKVAADISVIAEATKKLADKADSSAGGSGGVTASSGGLGGSGRHSDGSAAPGARLGDHNRSGQGSSPARGGGTTPAKGALAANQKEAYAAALKEGLSPTAARALVANMSGEALVIPHDRHWDGTHYSQGIVQWDPERVARIKAQFGKEPRDMSVADQTKAAIWEMKTRPEYAPSWKALQGNDPAAMIGTLVDNYERPKQRALPKAQRMGYYRGFNPGDPNPTVTVNGTPSHSDAPSGASNPKDGTGDAAALAAHSRIIAGKGTPADHALIEAHRRQQNTPAAPAYTKDQYDAAKRVAAIAKGRDMSKATDDERRAVGMTAGIIAAYEKAHPKSAVAATAPYAIDQQRQHGTTNTLAGLERSGSLDAAHQRLADAMRGGASGHPASPLDAARKKLADAMIAQAAEHHRVTRHIAEMGKGGKLDPAHLFRRHGPLGVSSSLHAAISSARHHYERHGDTFNIHGTDAKTGLDHAVKVSARRGGQDRIRFGQASQQ